MTFMLVSQLKLHQYYHDYMQLIASPDAANNLVHPPLIQYTEFSNSTLDHLDLMAEYYTWQNPTAHPG